MNKSILCNTLLITCLTLHTIQQEVIAEQRTEKNVFSVIKKLSEVDHDTLDQMQLDGDNDAVLDKHDQCPNSPAGDDVDRYGCTKDVKKVPKKEKVITISLLVNFENDEYNVDQKYFTEISRVAKFLKQSPNTSLVIEGHTSSQGDSEYNKRLSQKRANKIMKVLANEFSIDSNRLSAVGYGEEQLIDLADTTEAHTTNRRVVGKISTHE